MGEGEDFELPDSSTVTTAAIWDVVLSYIEQSKQSFYAKIPNTTFLSIYSYFFKAWRYLTISPGSYVPVEYLLAAKLLSLCGLCIN